MSLGDFLPSPSPSRPAPCQVVGMNCIGPTARSQTLSPSNAPSSLSRIAATGPLPFSATPTMAGRGTPSLPSTEPPYRPWSDSTRPMPASRVHGRWQPGMLVSIEAAACL